jgi:hypothetical protein
MMNKKASAKFNLLKYTLIAPVFIAMAACLNIRAEIIPIAGKMANEMDIDNVSIVFDKNVHDFGIIRERAGKTSTIFTFVNTGNKHLVINDVKASCGCTVPEWTKEPVAPGEKGYIRATYDPADRIYSFDRTLTVNSNGIPGVVVLHIKGITIRE